MSILCASSQEFPFGIDSKRAARYLRLLADEIEKQEIIPQKITTTEAAEVQDFTMTTFTFVYARRLVFAAKHGEVSLSGQTAEEIAAGLAIVGQST